MKPVTILLAEDNIDDQNLFEMALKTEGNVDFRVVSNGREALQYLRKVDKYADAPRPNLVVLDLNLPVINGPEVLKQMRLDPELKHIPVAIFTGAAATKELAELCQFNANFYIVKPIDSDEYFAIVKALEAYCRNLVQFPDLKKEYSSELRRFLKAT